MGTNNHHNNPFTEGKYVDPTYRPAPAPAPVPAGIGNIEITSRTTTTPTTSLEDQGNPFGFFF